MNDHTHPLFPRCMALLADPRLHAALRRQLPGHRGEDAALAAIHPHDPMVLHSLQHHGDAALAISQYYGVALQQHRAALQVMAACGVAPGRARILDFACGYGRWLRLLVGSAGAAQVVAADIDVDAVDFVRARFGVDARASHADPARFDPPERFDFIWVASLFSHLPHALFIGWLARLHALLSPTGVLCFSVRDRALLPAGEAGDGLRYEMHSENPRLDPAIYGTTYADADYVGDALRQVGAVGPWRRLPRALAMEQDLYVVARDDGHDLSALDGFRHGPWGWLDRCTWEAGVLRVQGWSGARGDGPAAAIEVRVDGRLERHATGVPRDDVAAAFDDPRLADCGFDVRIATGAAPPAWLDIDALDAHGARTLLFAGPPPLASGTG